MGARCATRGRTRSSGQAGTRTSGLATRGVLLREDGALPGAISTKAKNEACKVKLF